MLRPGELEIAKNAPPAGCTLDSAQQYTRYLATHHYENFNVASWLLPKALHQHFYNLYGYCRWADDLGDEVAKRNGIDCWIGTRTDALGRPSHPVFVALRETIVAKTFPSSRLPIC
jgi:phytoene/squalene synthetase